MKSFLLALIFITIITNNKAETINAKTYQNTQVDKYSGILDSIPPDQTGMRNLTSVELAKEMVPGWNVGNSLEAIGGETAWGNPKTTQKLIDSIKAAGFNAVRIPVAWSNNMDMATYTISPALLSRVEEVVNYILKDSMYAIVNIHWDGGWMNHPTYDKQVSINERLAKIWQQIAVHFRDYNDYLLFAGTNEVMYEGDYGTPKKEYYTVQNSFNQTFITTVRSTGGRNTYRHLVVQGFNTNINYTDAYFEIPYDLTKDRLMVEVHYYDPYNFTLNHNSTITQWGKYATDPAKTETWANESYADDQFEKMKKKFIDKGYAVILGEYAVTSRLNLGSAELNAEYAKYRRYYIEFITGSIYRHGLVPFYWDSGYTGDNASGIFNRSTGTQAYPDIIKAIMYAVDTNDVNTNIESLQGKENPKVFFLMQNYPNPFNPSTNIRFSIPEAGQVIIKVYDLLGQEIATLWNEYTNAGTYNVDFTAENLPSGIYIYEINSGKFIETRKMILLR